MWMMKKKTFGRGESHLAIGGAFSLYIMYYTFFTHFAPPSLALIFTAHQRI